MSFLQRVANVLKRWTPKYFYLKIFFIRSYFSSSNNFLGIIKGIEPCQQNVIDRLRFPDPGSFFTKIEDNDMFWIFTMFWTWYLSNWPEAQCLWTSLLLETLQAATRIETHHRRFYGDNFIPKNVKICLSCNQFLIQTKNYSIQTRILQNCITDYLWRCFEIAAQVILKNIQKVACSGICF